MAEGLFDPAARDPMEPATLHVRTVDPVMAGIIARLGPCELIGREPSFETPAHSITFQQLNGKAAGI